MSILQQHCKELVFIVKPEGFSAVISEQKKLKGFDWRQNCCRTFNEKMTFLQNIGQETVLALIADRYQGKILLPLISNRSSDGGSMERSVSISCSHNAVHIKL